MQPRTIPQGHQSRVSEQSDLVLECWIKSTSKLDDNSFVIIVFCQVSELLEVVNVVVNCVRETLASSGD